MDLSYDPDNGELTINCGISNEIILTDDEVTELIRFATVEVPKKQQDRVAAEIKELEARLKVLRGSKQKGKKS